MRDVACSDGADEVESFLYHAPPSDCALMELTPRIRKEYGVEPPSRNALT